MLVNLQNLQPVFGSEQLAASLQASSLAEVVLDSTYIVDLDSSNSDILKALPKDLDSAHLLKLASDSAYPQWSINESGFLHLDNWIYVPNVDNLRLHILRSKHDHILSGHFGQRRDSKALVLLRLD